MKRLAILLALVATPAAAALAPQYYEAARRDAPDVVAFQVVYVQMPRQAPLGTCTVGAKVIRVERGTRYAAGADLTIAIPCRRAGAMVPSGGSVWQDMDALGLSRFGRAFLDAGGQPVLDQYELLGGPDDEGVLR